MVKTQNLNNIFIIWLGRLMNFIYSSLQAALCQLVKISLTISSDKCLKKAKPFLP